jgi:hypothetical protein
VTGVNGVDGAYPFVGFACDPATGTVREGARAGLANGWSGVGVGGAFRSWVGRGLWGLCGPLGGLGGGV